MIWFSCNNKLYIKMMGYPWEIDWNLHHQYFLLKIQRKQQKWHDILLFQLFGPVLFSAHVYGSFAAAGARLADLTSFLETLHIALLLIY